MINIAGYTYDGHKACFICRHIIDGQPVLSFAHDEDGDLHFSCRQHDHTESDWHVVGLSHLLEQVLAMKGPPVVHPGFFIERTNVSAAWILEPLT